MPQTIPEPTVGLNDIREAHVRIAPHIHRTPVMTCRSLDEIAGARLSFKCENLQKAGAFKSRGACNAVLLLSDELAARGVVTHSSGNHAAALARAAALRNIPAHIVMPENAPAIKIAAVKQYGGKITFCEPTLIAREETAARVQAETGATMIHPYDNDHIIAGQGTALVELLEEVPDLEFVVAPVGGGGLLAGTAIAAKALKGDVQVIAAEPAAADDAFRSKQAGRVIPVENPATIADGLRTSLCDRTFAAIAHHVDKILLAEESAIISAMRDVMERAKLVIEPSSAVPLAAIIANRNLFTAIARTQPTVNGFESHPDCAAGALLLWFRLLPWEYGIRNLFRRPLRTALTFAGLTTVVVLVFVVVGFVRGLERTLDVSGDPNVAVVYAQGMGANLEYSSVKMKVADLVPASIDGIKERNGQKYVSPELYLGTQIGIREGEEPALGLVRGVTPSVLLVRNRVDILKGNWPKSGEVLVGRLAATKLGVTEQELRVGSKLQMEGRSWRVSGVFAAAGSAFESEIWCRLDELQQAMKRQDLSLVAMTLAPGADFEDVKSFCLMRLDLELVAISEPEYYAALQKDYGPVRWMAWLIVLLVSGAGVFAGLNTMYGSVIGRVQELCTLQTIGFLRRAILVSLIQEGILLAAAASLCATLLAIVFIHGAAIRFTMGAFAIQIDGIAVLIGTGVGLSLGFLGAIPPAFRVLRLPIVEGLKAA
eukprot:g26607.t1